MSNWSVDGTLLTLSISKNGNVIVASWNPAKIFEYKSDGIFVREIMVDQIDRNLVGLHHAIQLERDQFLVCHSTKILDRVCIIDNTGTVIKSYGGNRGSGMGQLDLPRHLAIDPHLSFWLLITRITELYNSTLSLEYMNEFACFQRPIRLLLNQELGRLYIIENE